MTARPKRRLFRFSLRTLLAFVTLVVVAVAWVARERHTSADEQQLARQLQGKGWVVYLGGPHDSWDLFEQDKPQGFWRDLAKTALGKRIIGVAAQRTDARGETLVTDTIDLSALATLTNVQFAFFSDVQITDLQPLAHLKKLQVIHLYNVPVRDLQFLVGLTNLDDLGLAGAQVSDVSPLAGLTNLNVLQLNGTQVSDLSPLRGLKNLEALYFGGTPVSNLTPLFDLKKLTSIAIWQTKISDEQVAEFRKAFPNCTIAD